MGDGKGTGACRTGVIYTTGSIFLQRHFGCVGKEMMACFGSLQNRMLKGGVVDSIRYSLRRHDFGFRWCRQNDIFTSLKGLLSPLGPHSGFGDKLLGTSVGCIYVIMYTGGVVKELTPYSLELHPCRGNKVLGALEW